MIAYLILHGGYVVTIVDTEIDAILWIAFNAGNDLLNYKKIRI
jgi:hypothetical protein